MSRIKEINDEINKKSKIISSLQKDICDLKYEKLEIETGLKIGDIVTNNKGEKGIITSYGQWGNWNFKKFKKDGTLYKNECCCCKARKIIESEKE